MSLRVGQAVQKRKTLNKKEGQQSLQNEAWREKQKVENIQQILDIEQ